MICAHKMTQLVNIPVIEIDVEVPFIEIAATLKH